MLPPISGGTDKSSALQARGTGRDGSFGLVLCGKGSGTSASPGIHLSGSPATTVACLISTTDPIFRASIRIQPVTCGGFKKDLYEGGIRVPTIVEWPGTIEHRVSHYPSGTIDIFLTLIDIAGLDPNSINPVNDGVSLASVFQNKEPPRRERPIGFRANAGLAWLDNDWKLVRNYMSGEDEEFELYNIVGDPSESNNLIKQSDRTSRHV